MKISKDALRVARQLFRMSFVDGKLDHGRVKRFVEKLTSDKPRNYEGTLVAYHRLLRLEVERRHAVVESAEKVTEELSKEIVSGLKAKYGDDLTAEFRENSELLGGMRVKIGSDVWDGSVKARLSRLADKL